MKEADIFFDDPKSAESIKQLEQVFIHHLVVNAVYLLSVWCMKYVHLNSLSVLFVLSVGVDTSVIIRTILLWLKSLKLKM